MPELQGDKKRITVKDNKKEKQTIFDIEYWTIEDAVRVTGLAKQTIYNLCSQGKMPHLKMRKRLVFIPQEVAKWISPVSTR